MQSRGVAACPLLHCAVLDSHIHSKILQNYNLLLVYQLTNKWLKLFILINDKCVKNSIINLYFNHISNRLLRIFNGVIIIYIFNITSFRVSMGENWPRVVAVTSSYGQRPGTGACIWKNYLTAQVQHVYVLLQIYTLKKKFK